MGHCSSDIYKTVKKQYGQTFQKFVVQSQTLIKFKQYLRSKQQQYDSKSATQKQTHHKQIQLKQHQLLNNFTQAKLNLDASLPFGVASYQQMKKTTLQNLLGLEGYIKIIKQSHAIIDQQSAQNKQSFHNKSEQILKKVEQQSKIDDQKLKTFHDLPQEKKKYIYDKGVKDFQDKIKARVEQLIKLYENELNPDNALQSLQKENKIELIHGLDNTLDQAKNHFKVETAKISGINYDSDIRI